jgi:hypothetical protein
VVVVNVRRDLEGRQHRHAVAGGTLFAFILAVVLFGVSQTLGHDSRANANSHRALSGAAGAGEPLPDLLGSYPWPVKPFDAVHPIRGTFGEPRTVFAGPPTATTLYRGAGSFSFHQGVDVVAADGAAVYPVRSGVVTLAKAMKVFVKSGSATSEEYWHILPSVHVGQTVTASQTVLGHIRRSYGHVHFTELRHGRPVNPLALGYLTPYRDRIPPTLGPVQFRRPGSDQQFLPELVHGSVEIGVPVSDRPDAGGSGIWAGLPTAPAVLSWKLERARDHRPVIVEVAVDDVRRWIPPQRAFWNTYLRGTRQNMPTFKLHRYWRQPGLFIFKLGVIDTRRLEDGIYVISVTARDIAGNARTERQVFTIFNRSGWPPPTPQS